MPVVATTLATDLDSKDAAHPILSRVMRALIPAANPDFESRFADVRLWWVEIDDHGVPQREIGFDVAGRAIVLAPDERNTGFWTDSPMVFSSQEMEAVDQASFDSAWERRTQASAGPSVASDSMRLVPDLRRCRPPDSP